MKRLELKGRVFGRLRVLGLSEISRNGHSRWHVRCECGTEKTVLGTHLVSGKTVSCSCKMREGRPRHFKGVGKVPKSYWNNLLRGASGDKNRNPIDFSITLEYIADLFEKQSGKCYLSGIPISFRDKTASLDRIDSSKGYEEGNVGWSHKDINMMKRHYTKEYFTFLCRKVTEGCEIVDLT